MSTRFEVALLIWTAVATALPGAAPAQSFPDRPVRMVTGAAGGAVDFSARVMSQGMSALLGQQVVVDNRPGTVTSGEVVARAAADGYTLLFASSNIWLAPFLRESVAYDPLRDFAAVTLAITAPNILVVNPAVPANSVKELIALAKAKPGELNYASANVGGASHLAAELFKSMVGVNLVHIPYKGAGPAITDMIAGHVQVMFATAGGVVPHIKSGRLRALAVTTPQPTALLPGLPTVAASGLPGYEAVSINGILAPAKTPASVIARLNRDAVQFCKTPEAKERFFKAGTEVVSSSPEEFMATIKTEMNRLGKVIRSAGIRDE